MYMRFPLRNRRQIWNVGWFVGNRQNLAGELAPVDVRRKESSLQTVALLKSPTVPTRASFAFRLASQII